jgi:hypothetical protein
MSRTVKQLAFEMKNFFLIILFCVNSALYAVVHAIDGGDASQKNGINSNAHDESFLLFELPGPLFSFGQNIVPKGSSYLSASAYQFKGRKIEFTLFLPRLVYGLREDLSMVISVPTAINFNYCGFQSSGLQDVRIALEYQLFKKNVGDGKLRMTILGSPSFPTGSIKKNPPTGLGSMGFFMGTTQAYLTHAWYLFFSDFYYLTTKKNGTKFGNTFLYQAGVGKDFYPIDRAIVTLMMECYGTVEGKSILCNVTDCNSGGNTLYCGPTVLLANEQKYIQGGIMFPVIQKLNGKQNKFSFFWGLSAGIKLF